MVVALIGLLIGTDPLGFEMMRAGELHLLPSITGENAARVESGMTLLQAEEILGPCNSRMAARFPRHIGGSWLYWTGKKTTVKITFEPINGLVATVTWCKTITVNVP